MPQCLQQPQAERFRTRPVMFSPTSTATGKPRHGYDIMRLPPYNHPFLGVRLDKFPTGFAVATMAVCPKNSHHALNILISRSVSLHRPVENCSERASSGRCEHSRTLNAAKHHVDQAPTRCFQLANFEGFFVKLEVNEPSASGSATSRCRATDRPPKHATTTGTRHTLWQQSC